MSLARLHKGRTWNATSESLGGNKRRTSFGVGEKCYLGADGLWHIIDCSLQTVGNVYQSEAGSLSCYFPERAKGEAFLKVNKLFDTFLKVRLIASDLGVTVAPEGALNVVGRSYQDPEHNIHNARIYESCFTDGDNAGDLVYDKKHGRQEETQKLVRWTPGNYPTKNLIIEFRVKYEDGPSNDIEISSQVIPQGLTRRQWRDQCRGRLNSPAPLSHNKGFYIRQKDSDHKRGMGIKTPTIWYNNTNGERVSQEINMTIRRESVGSDWYIIKKSIPKSFFDNAIGNVYTDATFTAYPDAGSGGATNDGQLYPGISSNWNTEHNAATAGNIDTAGNTMWIGPQWDGSIYRNRRTFMSYDISGLPPDANVNDVFQDIFVFNSIFEDNDAYAYIQCVEATRANKNDIVGADYTKCGAVHSPVKISDAIRLENMTASTTRRFTMDTNGKNVVETARSGDGIADYGTREGHDLDDHALGKIAGTVRNWLITRQSDFGSNKPALVIDYELPSGAPTAYYNRLLAGN